MNSSQMREQIRMKPKRKPALVTCKRPIPLVNCANMRFQVRLCLKLEPANLARKVSPLVVENLYTIQRIQKYKNEMKLVAVFMNQGTSF